MLSAMQHPLKNIRIFHTDLTDYSGGTYHEQTF